MRVSKCMDRIAGDGQNRGRWTESREIFGGNHLCLTICLSFTEGIDSREILEGKMCIRRLVFRYTERLDAREILEGKMCIGQLVLDILRD